MSYPSPMLHIPTRTTEEADFSEPFSDYIRVAFEQDGSKFKHEIATLNRLRQDVRGAGKDVTGRNILYRYYGQLELLDLRFPFDESHVHMSFSWKDSFTGEECSQYSIAFEKASVVYNIGAVCSSIAALQNRFEAEGLRMAFNYFQASAGLFAFINENFLHAPSVDMSRDSIKTLTELTLAQAQECFLEKVTVVEKKKGNMASKLCAQLSFMYMNVLDGLSLESVSGQFEKAWLELMKIKSKLFAALAHYHRHLQCEMDNQYGLSVSHIMVADTNIKEANKLAEKFAYNFPNFNISSQSNETSTTGKNPSSASTALLEITKMDLKMITDKLVVAKRDNDMIYHDTIPPVDSLAPLEKLNAVKAIPFADLLPNGQADIPQIVGNDIFAKLIPMSVHESSSVYSEEKSKLFRNQQKLIKQADDDIDATLNSLNLYPVMEQIKSLYNNPSNMSGEILTPEVMEWCVRVQENEMKSSKFLTEDLLNIINSLKPTIEEMLSEIPALLDQEQLDCENMRVKYMNSWTQEPSSALTATIRNELKAHKESYQKAVPLDNPIMKELDDSKNIIAILNRSVDKLEAYLVHCIVSAVPFDDKGSLLEENSSTKDPKIGILGEQISIEKIDSLIQHLRSLKKDRASILDEMKEKIKKDDISSLLLLNKSKEKQIFKSELTKYAELQTKISSNIESHNQFLTDLVTEFKKLATSSKALSLNDARIQEKLRILQDWRGQFQRYKLAKDGLRKGRVFYTDLKSSLDELKAKVVKFVNQRNAERLNMEKKIEAEIAESGQRAIKEQLQKLSVESSARPGAVLASYAQPALGSIQHHSPLTEQHMRQFPSSHNDSSQSEMTNLYAPSDPEISPQGTQLFVSQNADHQQGPRTPIPQLRTSRQSPVSRDSSVSARDIDHSPTSNHVANHPRATFDAQQFHALASREQSTNIAASNQGGLVPVQRANSQTKEQHQYAENSGHYSRHTANRVQAYDPSVPIHSSVPDRGYSNQTNGGSSQFYRPPQNIPVPQEYLPPQSYAPPQGYMPQQSIYQPQPGAPLIVKRPPQGVQPQRYQNPEYRPNPSGPGAPIYRQQMRSDVSSTRPGQAQQNPQFAHLYGSGNQEYQGYRVPSQPIVSNRPTFGAGYPANVLGSDSENRPISSQAFQRPESNIYPTQSGPAYPVYPPNQGYAFAGANTGPPFGYNQREMPPMQGYRPPANVIYAQQGQPQYQQGHAQYPRPPNTQQGQVVYQQPPNPHSSENAQYNPSQQNTNFPGQNHRGSLMD